jgi:hypothetical protein
MIDKIRRVAFFYTPCTDASNVPLTLTSTIIYNCNHQWISHSIHHLAHMKENNPNNSMGHSKEQNTGPSAQEMLSKQRSATNSDTLGTPQHQTTQSPLEETTDQPHSTSPLSPTSQMTSHPSHKTSQAHQKRSTSWKNWTPLEIQIDKEPKRDEHLPEKTPPKPTVNASTTQMDSPMTQVPKLRKRNVHNQGHLPTRNL